MSNTILLLFGLALCVSLVRSETHYFLYNDGQMKVGKDTPQRAFGDMVVEWHWRFNYTEVDGMFDGVKHVPFTFLFDIKSYTNVSNTFNITGVCSQVRWFKKWMKPVSGRFEVAGTWDKMALKANCTDLSTNISYVINLEGAKHNCFRYGPSDAAVRAEYLVGESREMYESANMLNYAYFDSPYISVMRNCKPYLKYYGELATEPRPGYTIVGRDGMHCAIVGKDGQTFIHSSPISKVVVKEPFSRLSYFFRFGWVYKQYSC